MDGHRQLIRPDPLRYGGLTVVMDFEESPH